MYLFTKNPQLMKNKDIANKLIACLTIRHQINLPLDVCCHETSPV